MYLYTYRMPLRRLFNFVISDEMAEGLKAVKERDGISESEQVRRAVAAWLTSKGISLRSSPKAGSKKRSHK